MRAGRGDWSVYQSPLTINSAGQKSRIFIVRLHDNAVPFKGVEIFGERKRHAGSPACIRGKSDGVLF